MTTPPGISNRLVRLKCWLDSTSHGTTWVYAQIKDGLIPPPIKRGKSALWPSREVDAVVSAMIAGQSDEQLRALVRNLVAARQDLPPRTAGAMVRDSQQPSAAG